MYPEYRYAHLSAEPNHVYRAVRDIFAQAGLDREHLGTSEWNPLGAYIRKGSRVFVLCNFVTHRYPKEGQLAFWAKCTHGSVLRAVVDYIVLAVGPSGKVIFGNAPLQSCNWQKVLQDTGADRVLEFYKQRGIEVRAQDLRLFIAPRKRWGCVAYVDRRDDTNCAVEVDLADESLLSSLGDNGGNRFRVIDYNPKRTQAYHTGGHHVYVVNRAVLESDVVFSLPKLKTHKMVGLTCALKGFVGTIGHKDCLAHHRFGPPDQGGDEYPRYRWLLLRLSQFRDWVNTRDWPPLRMNSLRMIDYLVQHLLIRMGVILGGAWYGNDTAWRMALDTARILMYATTNGNMQPSIQRRHLAFVDGIIAGEGDGPLVPSPIKAGVLLFSDDVGLCDWACCRLIGFDFDRVPIVREAFNPFMSFAVSRGDFTSCDAYLNGRVIRAQELTWVGKRPFRPPRGWRGYVEMR